MKKCICLLAFCAILISCNKWKDYLPDPGDQAHPLPQFNKLFGGSAYDAASNIQVMQEDGYLITGATASSDGDVSGQHGAGDAWVLKVDQHGIRQWQKTFGGSGYDNFKAAVATPDGGFLLSGTTFSSDGDVSNMHGVFDIWLVKLNKWGDIDWEKAIGGSSDDDVSSITTTTDGGYILSGRTRSNDGDVSGNHGDCDAWIVKLDNTGNIIWQKTLGGSGYDETSSVIKTFDGGYIVSAFAISTDGDVTDSHGNGDAWIVKLSKDGNIQWQKALGGSGTELPFSITTAPEGGYVVSSFSDSNDGDVSGNHGTFDAWIVNLDSDGNLKWQKTFGGTGEDILASISPSKGGGYILCGNTFSNDGDVSGNHGEGDAWIVKIDKKGKLEWQKTIGGSKSDFTSAIIQRRDKSYVLAGVSSSNDGDVSGNHGDSDAWVFTIKNQ